MQTMMTTKRYFLLHADSTTPALTPALKKLLRKKTHKGVDEFFRHECCRSTWIFRAWSTVDTKSEP